MKLTMLGTGHADVTECYNTCFILSEGGRHFLVDGGTKMLLGRNVTFFDSQEDLEAIVL